MATRFYFLAGTTPPVSPAFSTSWSSTTGMTRLRMDTSKVATAFTDYQTSTNPFGGSYTGVVQLVSRPLDGDQTITASGWRPPVIRVKNISGVSTKELTYLMRVCTNDGSSFRGTLYARNYQPAADFPGSYTSIAPTQDNMTSVSALSGDRIVLEIGFRNNDGSAGTNAMEIGDASSSDLGTTTGETNQYNPWSEMVSLNLSFQVEGGTAHTKTISNSVVCFGLGPSTKWGATYSMVWGSSKWGEGTLEIQHDIGKVISNAQSLSDSLTKSFDKPLSEQLTSTFEGTQQNLTDAAGYYWIFPGSVTDADERASVTYTEGSAASTSWTAGSGASTTWS